MIIKSLKTSFVAKNGAAIEPKFDFFACNNEDGQFYTCEYAGERFILFAPGLYQNRARVEAALRRYLGD